MLRVPPKQMAGARKSARSYGKSDPIDAEAVARAALRQDHIHAAHLDGPAREIKPLADHREDLVQEGTRIASRLRWHLHDLDPALEAIPAGALDRGARLDRTARRLARREQGAQVRVARELLRRCRELSRQVKALESELATLVEAQAGPLLALPGCGTLTAAKLIGEVAGLRRFSSAARLAMHAGVAPLDASSGQQRRHRLNPHGNRQLNAAFHRVAVTQGRVHAPARAYLARKQAEGHSRREALRCLKRQLAGLVCKTLTALDRARSTADISAEPEGNRRQTMILSGVPSGTPCLT